MYHHCRVIPGLLTIRSNYRWTLAKLLIAGILVVIGLLILKRFGSPLHGYDPRMNYYGGRSAYQPSASAYAQRHVDLSAAPAAARESIRFERSTPLPTPRFARPPEVHTNEYTFIPTRLRRKKLTKRQKLRVLQHYENQCALCRKELEPFDTEFDHIRPLASDAYGEHDDLNHISNFRPLCRRCHGYVTWRQRKAGMFQRNHRRRAR